VRLHTPVRLRFGSAALCLRGGALAWRVGHSLGHERSSLAPDRLNLAAPQARIATRPQRALTPCELPPPPHAQSSGVPVDPACYTLFAELQTKHCLRWIVYGIKDNLISVVASADASKKGREAWAEFTSAANMPDCECKYGVFDLDIQMDDGVHERENAKIIFVNWADDNSKIKIKMVHASSKDIFRKGLNGCAVDYQASDRDELKYNNMLEMKAGELKIPKVSLEKMLA